MFPICFQFIYLCIVQFQKRYKIGNMASIKLLLQNPYASPDEDMRTSGPTPGDKLSTLPKRGKKRQKKLSPYPTRLYCFQIIDRKHTIKIKTEHTILPKEWNFRMQQKKENIAGATEFNLMLAELKTDLTNQYNYLRKKYPDMSFEELSTAMKQYGKTKELPEFESKGFFEALDEFKKDMEGQVTEGTIKKFKTLKIALLDFVSKHRKYNPLTFRMINPSFRTDFVKYLQTREPKGRQKRRPEGQQSGLLVDTQGKYIETLKTFCRWAQEERPYNKHDGYKKIQNITKAERPRMKPAKDIVTLTLAELHQFYLHDFTQRPALGRVRDIFCFAAFTGQRWSDIEKFDKSQIKGDVWSFKAQKTKKNTEIDLIGYAAPALVIAKKYDYELPIISLQKFNQMLKEAARLAGIVTPTRMVRYVGVKEVVSERPKCEFLSSHAGRKSFVTIMLNDEKMPITNVLEMTGHSEVKTLQKYIDVARQARRENMSKTKPVTEVMRVVKNKAV